MNHHHPDNGPEAYQRAIARKIKNRTHAKMLSARDAFEAREGRLPTAEELAWEVAPSTGRPRP